MMMTWLVAANADDDDGDGLKECGDAVAGLGDWCCDYCAVVV